jgi:DNA-binding CsgD family transcriptional regulator
LAIGDLRASAGDRLGKSTAARAAARFKQLSCFGLDKEAVIPELLKELHSLIPSFANTFHFTDHAGVLANIYFENTDLVKLWPLYQQEFLELREREIKGLAFSDASRTQVGVHEFNNATSEDGETFHRGDHYNLIVRPLGYDSNFLRLYFRESGRLLGGLTIWRSPSAGSWTSQDKRRLASLGNFFVHALMVKAAPVTPLVDGGENGLIIADATGKPVYFSAEGLRLLFLATSPRRAPGISVSRSPGLPAAVTQLCRNLSRIFSDDASAAAPIHHHANIWGGFTFRASWLDRDDGASRLIAITVSHRVPLPIRLARGSAKLPLSRRQTEVCLLMATGASNETIGERLGISKHTANEHARWIYNKLDVHSRAELVSKILSG